MPICLIMAVVNNITGQAQVLANLNRKRKELGLRFAQGLKLAGLLLQRESMVMVPVEYGPLKASAYTRSSGVGFETVVTVGYTAAYALYVHEQVAEKLRGQPRPSGRGLFWDPSPQAQSKFLEKALRSNMDVMKALVKTAMKI